MAMGYAFFHLVDGKGASLSITDVAAVGCTSPITYAVCSFSAESIDRAYELHLLLKAYSIKPQPGVNVLYYQNPKS